MTCIMIFGHARVSLTYRLVEVQCVRKILKLRHCLTSIKRTQLRCLIRMPPGYILMVLWLRLPGKVDPGCARVVECLSRSTNACKSPREELEEATREKDVWTAMIVINIRQICSLKIDVGLSKQHNDDSHDYCVLKMFIHKVVTELQHWLNVKYEPSCHVKLCTTKTDYKWQIHLLSSCRTGAEELSADLLGGKKEVHEKCDYCLRIDV